MARNYTTITRLPAVHLDGSTPIVPGDSRRRVISFHNCDGLGSLQVSPNPIQGLQFALFQVVTDPFFLLLKYDDWGEFVTREWFLSTSGIGMDLAIVQTFIV